MVLVVAVKNVVVVMIGMSKKHKSSTMTNAVCHLSSRSYRLFVEDIPSGTSWQVRIIAIGPQKRRGMMKTRVTKWDSILLGPLLLFPFGRLVLAFGPTPPFSFWMDVLLDPFFSLFPFLLGKMLLGQHSVSLKSNLLFPWSTALFFFLPCLPIPIGSQGLDA